VISIALPTYFVRMRFALAWVRGVAAAVVLLTAGIFSPRLRGYLRTFAREVGVTKPHQGPFPVKRPDAVGDPTLPLALPGLDAQDGNVSALELAVLARLVKSRGPALLWEIGTFDGRTTRVLAANAPNDAQVHTLDLPADGLGSTAHALTPGERGYVRKPTSGARFAGTPEAAKITQHLGDSATFDFTPWRRQVDFVFIDGSHAAAYVHSDTNRAGLLTDDRKAVVVWHDYGEWPGVTETLDTLAPTMKGAYRVAGTTLVVWERS
jgi:hypothetical protein